jgi:NAD(P)-dependent dehydrogenase (short-subunit alcohol dehydrogenase family)
VRAMDLGLAGKQVMVSGSTAGIGLAIAAALAAEGAHVTINGRTQARVDAALATLRGGGARGELRGVAADLATEEGAKTLLAALPAVDVLVNNLGIFEPKPFLEIPDDDWRRFFEVNVVSGVRLSRAYLPGMLAKNWGRIVFISSESGLQIPAEMIHYGTTKMAQLAVSRGIAESVAGTGVTVNCVLPGPTGSEGVGSFVADLARAQNKSPAQVEKEFFATMRPSSLIQRFATVEEVAAIVTYVCSERASATTGAALRVDGGVLRAAIG